MAPDLGHTGFPANRYVPAEAANNGISEAVAIVLKMDRLQKALTVTLLIALMNGPALANPKPQYPNYPSETPAKFVQPTTSKLSFTPPASGETYDEYVSDPARPVPFRRRPSQPIGYTAPLTWPQWLVNDQRDFSGRTDVLLTPGEKYPTVTRNRRLNSDPPKPCP